MMQVMLLELTWNLTQIMFKSFLGLNVFVSQKTLPGFAPVFFTRNPPKTHLKQAFLCFSKWLCLKNITEKPRPWGLIFCVKQI